MSGTEFVRTGPGHFTLTIAGRAHPILFPTEGNLEQIVVQTLGGQEYAPLRLDGWQPKTIVDVGANIGATAIFFSLCYPTASIQCFEPSPSTAVYLRQNTAWLPNIQVQEVGLFNRAAEVPLYAGVTQCAQASISASIETNAKAHETIRLVPASQAIGPVQRPAILKIDTEGCEVPVLHDLAARLHEFDLIYVEWHSDQDRRRIDAQLGSAFKLWKSKASAVHRGTAAYLHQRVIDAHPHLGMLEIPAVEVAQPMPALV